MSINSVNSSSTRLTGLSSGMDTEAMVTSMMKASQTKYDKQFQAKTRLEWKSDAYRDVNNILREFRSGYMSVLAPSANMLSAANYRNNSVTMLQDTKAVSISAVGSSASGTITIDHIDHLAAAAGVTSRDISTEELSPDTQLKDLALSQPLAFDDGQIEFSINGKAFTFDDTVTLGEMLNTINMDADAGVTMSYSSLKKGFVMTGRTTGSLSAIDIVNLRGNAFYTAGAFGLSQGSYRGQDARLTIDGSAVTRSGNAFTIDGVSYSLSATSNTALSFRVERDAESTVGKVKAFVDAYNGLVDKLQTKLSETVNRTYNPLTDDERSKLSDSQQEKWDSMAKSGLLSNDSDINSLLISMRDAFYTTVAGTGMNASDLGLQTGSYLDGGKITLDENQLRTALQRNPSAVETVFTGTSGTGAKPGLVTSISNAMNVFTEKVTRVNIAGLTTNISAAESLMTDMQKSMKDEEDRYWTKFSAMESALAQMNSQSSWLTAQLNAL